VNQTVEVLRDAGRVKRLHTVPTTEIHTLARHVYGSQVIALFLLERNPSADVGRVLKALLIHDAPEVETGDIPAPTKRRDIAIYDALERMEKQFYEGHKLNVRLTALEADLVKACDILDLGLAIKEEFIQGNTHHRLYLVRSNVLAYLSDFEHIPGVKEAVRWL